MAGSFSAPPAVAADVTTRRGLSLLAGIALAVGIALASAEAAEAATQPTEGAGVDQVGSISPEIVPGSGVVQKTPCSETDYSKSHFGVNPGMSDDVSIAMPRYGTLVCRPSVLARY